MKKRNPTIQLLCKELAQQTILLQKSLNAYLLGDANSEQLAKEYAQIISYCIFAVGYTRKSKSSSITLEDVSALISKPGSLSKMIHQIISISKKDQVCRQNLDTILQLVQHFDFQPIIDESKKHVRSPLIHFYELFLDAFEKEMRNKRGVFYTPQPVVSFIVQKTHQKLQQDFALPRGLASAKTWSAVARENKQVAMVLEKNPDFATQPFVQILDPATGTGTFILECVDLIRETMLQSYRERKLSPEAQKQDWKEYIRGEGEYQGCGLLERISAIEIMPIPYYIFHIHLTLLLQNHTALPYEFGENDTIPVYLGNALDSVNIPQTTKNPIYDIKQSLPITVVVGNPPYKGEGETRNAWINSLIDDYRCEPGGVEKLQEQQSKWLGDDYVRFMRLAQYILERTGLGILSFINPHGYIDNPTFRGMRWHLLTFFQNIDVFDLHGNANRQETTPDGTQDDNVFMIRQGVAVNIFSRYRFTERKQKYADVRHCDLYGLREEKLNFISKHIYKKLPYKNVSIRLDNLLRMCPSDMKYFEQYMKDSISVHDLFTVTGAGMATAHDKFVISFRKEDLIRKFQKFKSSTGLENELHEEFNVRRKKGWSIGAAHKRFQGITNVEDYIYPINYRPFDRRYVMYEDSVIWSSGKKALKHYIRGENIGLIYSRTVNGPFDWQDIQVTKSLIEYGIMATRVGNGAPSAPLFVYEEDGTRKINMKKNLAEKMIQHLGLTYSEDVPDISKHTSKSSNVVSPLDIMDYIFAYLHAPSYRKTYSEYLKKDYPRVPFPKHKIRFWKLVQWGHLLRKLQLFEDLDTQASSKYPLCGIGDNRITKTYSKKNTGYVNTTPDMGRVYINEHQYFDGVSTDIWNFFVGGYQPAQQWLKSKRRDYGDNFLLKNNKISNPMTEFEIKHYQNLLNTIEKTIQYMTEIDNLLCSSPS